MNYSKQFQKEINKENKHKILTAENSKLKKENFKLSRELNKVKIMNIKLEKENIRLRELVTCREATYGVIS